MHRLTVTCPVLTMETYPDLIQLTSQLLVGLVTGRHTSQFHRNQQIPYEAKVEPVLIEKAHIVIPDNGKG